MNKEFTIGADPELFVREMAGQNDGAGGGHFISAHDLIPGTKEDPHPVNMGFIQRDGVAAEFNIHPVTSANDFLSSIRAVMKTLQEDFLGPRYQLVAQPTAYFDKEYFDSLPDDPKVLGCTPDYNAYTGEPNIPPETTEPFRTGSGHVHIGWSSYEDIYDPEYFRLCCNLVRQLDQALYFPSLAWDTDTKRRTLYGRMGAFRPKHYGLEYRPLSNAYLRDDNLIEFVYERTVWAADLFFNKGVKLYDNAPDLPEKYR